MSDARLGRAWPHRVWRGLLDRHLSSAAGPQCWCLVALCCSTLLELLSSLQKRIMWVISFIMEPMVAWVFGPADLVPIRSCEPQGVGGPHYVMQWQARQPKKTQNTHTQNHTRRPLSQQSFPGAQPPAPTALTTHPRSGSAGA